MQCFPAVQLRFAIPQITARKGGVNEDTTRSDAALAVQSIPAYVEACDLFLGLAFNVAEGLTKSELG